MAHADPSAARGSQQHDSSTAPRPRRQALPQPPAGPKRTSPPSNPLPAAASPFAHRRSGGDPGAAGGKPTRQGRLALWPQRCGAATFSRSTTTDLEEVEGERQQTAPTEPCQCACRGADGVRRGGAARQRASRRGERGGLLRRPEYQLWRHERRDIRAGARPCGQRYRCRPYLPRLRDLCGADDERVQLQPVELASGDHRPGHRADDPHRPAGELQRAQPLRRGRHLGPRPDDPAATDRCGSGARAVHDGHGPTGRGDRGPGSGELSHGGRPEERRHARGTRA